jgi:tRNA nucleotidyltransferase (CCA-adding enzyme)
MMTQKTIFNLSPDTLPFDLDLLPSTTYLVGGAVRDALLNYKRDYLDLDFVLPEFAVETARKIANHYHGGFVVLDAQRNIARVVLKQGTVDFAQQEGDSIEKDLGRRDFTINAIAYNFHQQKLIDPLGGLQDLQAKTLRMIAIKNLQDDPLRLLRAYRQAAQLNFTIETKTRHIINKLSPLITTVAAERVQAELNYLLGNSRGSYWLNEMGKEGLLTAFFRHINQQKRQEISQIDQEILLLKNKLQLKNFLALFNLKPNENIYSSPLIIRSKLTCLVSNLPEEAEAELLALKYSNNDIKSVLKVLDNLPFIQNNQGEISLRNLYFFFLNIGKNFPILALVGLVKDINNELIFKLINHYLNPKDKVAHPFPLVTGHDLIQHLNIKPSPQLGQLLTEISIAHMEEKISTKEEALIFAKSYLDSNWF